MRRPMIGWALVMSIVIAAGTLPAAAGPKLEVQGFGAPAANVKPWIARRTAYAAAVAMALYEAGGKAGLSFARGLRLKSQGGDSDLTVTLPKSRIWGREQVLHVLKSALAEPEARKLSIARLKWTLARNGVKVRRVDYKEDNSATVTLAVDTAKMEKVSAAQAGPGK